MCGGEWDIPLNDVGQEQSLSLSTKVLDLVGPSIEEIYASPMLRAQQTAENINQKLCLEITTVEDLKEWCVGDWEKQPWESVPNPFNTTEEPPNGETREAFEARVVSAINKTLANSIKTVLFVSHGAFAHALFTVLGVDRLQIENCEIYKVEPFDKQWYLSKVT